MMKTTKNDTIKKCIDNIRCHVFIIYIKCLFLWFRMDAYILSNFTWISDRSKHPVRVLITSISFLWYDSINENVNTNSTLN